MAFKFEVDLNNLEMYNNRLNNRLIELRTQIADLDYLIALMPTFWEGDAAEAYIRLMKRRAREARDVYEALEALQVSVNTQIRELKEVDNIFEVWGYELFCW